MRDLEDPMDHSAPFVALAWLVALSLLLAGCPDVVADDDVADDDVADDDTGDDDTGDDDTFAAEELDPQRIFDDVAWLADDAREGRAAGTQGNDDALDHVEGLFTDLGLAQAGGDGSYRQTFGFAQWEQLAPAELEIGGDVLTDGSDFGVFQNSGAGDVTAELVFVGYGLTVPSFDGAKWPDCPFDPAGYDDYAALDLDGRIALALRHGPNDDDATYEECPINEVGLSPGAHWTFGYKAANAAAHGAAALVLVADYQHGPSPVEGYLGSDYAAEDFPAVSPNRDRVEAAVPDLEAWAGAIDASLQPGSVATGVTARVTVDAATSEVETANLHGVLEGTDPDIGHEVIVIGAHLDHIGTAPDGDINNGADDNASGSAVMMELARLLTGCGRAPARTVMFSSYNAEELGLIGSCHYVGEPTYPLEDTVAMLSVDMVGAGDGSGLIFYGADHEPFAWLSDLAAAASADLPYDVIPGPSTYNSDHGCFAWAGIPAMMALTAGEHGYYHTPQDTIDTILIEDLEAAASILWATLEPLAMGEEDAWLDGARQRTAVASPWPHVRPGPRDR